MKFTRKITLAFFLCFCTLLFAQKEEKKVDSITLYHDIYNFSKKSKTKRFFYKLFFRESALDTSKTKKSDIIFKPNQKEFHGKIIRKIHITTLDPFGYSVTDTLKIPKRGFDKFGNKIHFKTTKFTIQNLLLFKENTPYDSLKITETERLIRSQRYTRRVQLTTIPTEIVSDSVDIHLRILDSWSLIPNGSLSSSKGSFKLAERNLFGLGHQIKGDYRYRFDDQAKAVSTYYTISNLKNTYIKIDLGYENDFDNNSVRNISINREFYSPLTKWAGGGYFENRRRIEDFNQVIYDSIVKESIRRELVDVWLGRSFAIKKNFFSNRTTRLITALSFSNSVYKEKPESYIDSSGYFTNERNFIGQIGITSQRYYQDKFLFNYDITEDIPFGEIYALKFGLQDKNGYMRSYLGSKIAYGKRISFGYLSSSAEFGTFFGNSLPSQTAFKTEINYFTDLIYWKNWRFRQFIRPSYIFGKNRYGIENDYLTLDNNWGIDGFNSPITGTQKWVLNLQTQTYAPGLWAGFRFSPYFNITFGSLINNGKFFDNKVYSKYSVGILLNNDYLVFNSFQISLSYYPSIPFVGDGIFKTNSFENDNLTIPDFQLSKPSYIEYK